MAQIVGSPVPWFRNTIITSVVVFALMFVVAGQGIAETATNSTIQRGSKIFNYISSKGSQRALVLIAGVFDRKIRIACRSKYVIKILSVRLYGTVDFPDGNDHPIAGAWRYQYEVTRCDKSKVYNVIFVSQKGNKPKPVTLLPGTTGASPRLQRDAMNAAVASAAAKLPKSFNLKDCKDIFVFNTKLTIPPHNANSAAGAWEEEWTFRFCGTEAVTTMEFVPDGKGGTNFISKM